MRVLGLDPGSRRTGWGVVETRERRLEAVAFGCLKPPRKVGRPALLRSLAESFARLLGELEPDVVVIETPFTAHFPRAALGLAEVRGALLVEVARWGGTLVEYEPARVKAAVVGMGRAEKRQVAFVVSRELRLTEIPDADTADALALALCHLRSIGPRAWGGASSSTGDPA